MSIGPNTPNMMFLSETLIICVPLRSIDAQVFNNCAASLAK